MASNSLLFNPNRKIKIKPEDELLQPPGGVAPAVQPQQAPRTPQLSDFQPPTGEGGKVVSPLSGKKVNQPKGYADALAVLGPQEAMNFQFNLRDSRNPEIVQSLLGASQKAGQDRETALQEVKDLQAKALAPNLDPETRQFFQNMADERRAEVMSRFAPGGDVANQFERQAGANLAQLANRGVLDTTTGSQALARQNVDLAALTNNLLNQAAEQSRAELLAEREGLRGAATQFGGLQGQLATSAGQLQQQGLGTAGQLDLAGREQDAQLQLAELGQRLLGSQTALQNIQSLRNTRQNRQQARRQAQIQEELLSKIGSGQLLGSLLGIGGAGIGAALGGPAGAAIGGGLGGQLGRSF